MGTPTNYFIDPVSGNDSTGDGSVGTPWKTAIYAFGTGITRDSTNGDQLNVQDSGDDVTTAALDASITTYGTPTNNAPLIIRGYTTAANDGGQGGLSGNAAHAIYGGTKQYIIWKDMHLHNCGSANILQLNSYSTADNCQLDNTTGNGIVMANYASALLCDIQDIAGDGIELAAGCRVVACYFKDGGTNKFTVAIDALTGASYGSYVGRNIISLSGNGVGVGYNYAWTVEKISILAASSTGKGITPTAAGRYGAAIISNAVEGFSGAGGVGIDYGSNEEAFIGGKNSVYNCTTAFSGSPIADIGDDETLGASPFDKSGADTFANRLTYFSPVDTGLVHGDAYQ